METGSTYEELKKILVLLVAISVTGVVLQMTVVHSKYNKGNSRGTLQQITQTLRHGIYSNQVYGDLSEMKPLMNLSRQSNESLDHILLQNMSLPFAEWVKLMELRQQIRRDRMNLHCADTDIPAHTVDDMLVRKGLRATLYSNDELRVTLSVVKKAASNNLDNLFKEFGGMVRLFTLPEEMCRDRIGKYMRVLFVRHPLSRFVSAYNDKFVYHHIDHFLYMGRHIIQKFRRELGRRERIQAAKKGDDVRFEEFIEFILSDPTYRKNTHWNAYWTHNRVCELRHDFIGKIETFEDDVRFLLYKLGVSDFRKRGIPPAYLSYHPPDRGLLRSYYERVPKTLLRELHNIYQRDFDMFGYSTDVVGKDLWS